MGILMANDPSDTLQLVERLRGGDRQALTDLFQRHRDRLRRLVELRMDARLQGRVDASDVLQDAFLDAAARAVGLRLASGARIRRSTAVRRIPASPSLSGRACAVIVLGDRSTADGFLAEAESFERLVRARKQPGCVHRISK